MTAGNTVTVTYCEGGALALQLPFAVWFGITVIGFFYSGELSLLSLSLSYYPQLYLNYILKQVIQQPYLEDSCRTGLDTPSVESQLASSFAVFVLAFNGLRGCRIKCVTFLILSFLWLGVPSLLYYTHNSSFLSVLLGASVGTGCGLLLALLVHLYLSPHFDSMTQWCLFHALGYCNNLYHRTNGEDVLTSPSHAALEHLLPKHREI